MREFQDRGAGSRPFRHKLLAYTAVVSLVAGGLPANVAFAAGEPIDLSKWSPEYVKSIAGTEEFDTAAECSKVVPLDYKGRLTYWYTGPSDAEPEITKQMDKEFWAAWKATYPNIETDAQNINYNDLLDKFRTALLGNAGPMVVRLQILGGVEFAAKGYLQELKPEAVGYATSDFWPGAIKSVTWEGKPYGIPTNNETMAFIWNAKIFKDAGLDPEKPPATWDDVVAYSKTIHDKLGIAGYGLVAKQNAGNTPFRFMPQLWAYGGAALDEADAAPNYGTVGLNSAGAKAALQASYDMYVRDKSVPVSALTNTQAENQSPFIAGQLAMMIAHPAEYAKMLDLSGKATGDDKKVADEVVANMRYGLIPEGPARRAVVFGGSNIHVLKPEYVDGGHRRDGGEGAHLHVDEPRMVHAAQLGRLEPGQSPRLQDQVDEGTPGDHQVPRRHHLDAAERHSVPGHSRGAGDHEYHRPGHAAECVDRQDDGGRGGRGRGDQGRRAAPGHVSLPREERPAAFGLPVPSEEGRCP